MTSNIEETLIGLAINIENLAPTILDRVPANWIQSKSNRVIYDAIETLVTNGHPVNAASVAEQLNQNGTLASANMNAFSASAINTSELDYYINILHEAWMNSNLKSAAKQLSREADDPTISATDARNNIESTLALLDQNVTRNDPQSLAAINSSILNPQSSFLNPVSTGFKFLDDLTHGGWQPSDLIIIAARPGIGKSALALTMAIRTNIPVALFSLEMSKEQIARRAEKQFLAKTAGELFPDTEAIEQRRASIIIDDTPSLTLPELKRKVRRLVAEHHIQLVIVDYLQLMVGTNLHRNANREQEVASLSRGLKALAKELKMPVIALSQLNRQVEQRREENCRPRLADLRESGAIEQDADIVMFIHRPINLNPEDPTQPVELIVAKHRNGQTKDFRCQFHKPTVSFI